MSGARESNSVIHDIWAIGFYWSDVSSIDFCPTTTVDQS